MTLVRPNQSLPAGMRGVSQRTLDKLTEPAVDDLAARKKLIREMETYAARVVYKELATRRRVMACEEHGGVLVLRERSTVWKKHYL
jgi:hypothetical protein